MKLHKINLKRTKIIKDDNDENICTHPDIKLNDTWYLLKEGANFLVGNFTMEWFGLSFMSEGTDIELENFKEYGITDLWRISSR